MSVVLSLSNLQIPDRTGLIISYGFPYSVFILFIKFV